AVSGATGALFGVVGSRPYWHTGLLPLLFIAAALLSAAAMLTIFAALASDDDSRRDTGVVPFLGRLTLGLLAVTVLVEWADVSIAWAQHSQRAAGWAAWDLVLTGPRWWVFWFVHVAAGVLLPGSLLLLRPRSVVAVGGAAALVGVTLLSVRLNVVIPGLAVPQIEGLDEAYTGPGLTFSYTPTLQEWLVSIFAGALFVGLIGAWYRFVPARLEAAAQPDALPAGVVGAETRGDFLGKVGIAGGALLASQLPLALHGLGEPGGDTNSPLGSTPFALANAENILYSVCQQCNTQCGIKAKLMDGVLVKIDGNPYSPWTMKPPVSYETPLTQAAAVDGWICPKGQAGIQAAYDPYRIRKALKRDGPRGSGRWKTIEFDDAVTEIVEGGDHFGEGRVPGLAELWALRDPDLAKAMGDDVKAIWDGKLTVAEFKTKHRQNLDALIDPDHPDLGPRNNQVVFAWGRLKSGRGELLRRFIQESFGSVNAHGHTTVCQGSLYFAGKAMSEQWIDGKWQKGAKAYWQADVGEAEFVIFVGASPFEANYGPPYRTSQITDGLVDGRLKIAVVDPRLSKTAAKAWKWLPARPGSEGALALAMIRWIVEQERYDAAFLRNANKAAAEADGEKTWTNATWLVHAEDENEGKLVRASEIGLGEAEERLDAKGKPYEYDRFVVLVSGKPVAVDPADEENAVVGDLVVDTAIGGTRVKSGFRLLTESARSKTLREWAEVIGVDPTEIVELAREFTSHGKKAAADVHRGVSQHTNGYSNVIAWNTLNALVGNYDWAGGMSKATTYSVTADKDGEAIEGMPFFLTGMHPAKISPFGISSIRHDA
ncbi:MAG TPA: NrfD/PsrC family molybdoenzyme membrane anchor subunit, partial [Gaiellaceae bacterium]|nr:NrfD/PsrC family molybdoenzyme membrane anchor subunit [Gaiellaceae bacterium]